MYLATIGLWRTRICCDVFQQDIENNLILCITYPESVKCICADLEQTLVYPIEELPKHALARGWLRGVYAAQIQWWSTRLIVKNKCSDCIVFQCLLEYATTRHCTLSSVIAIAQRNDDLGSGGDDILQGNGLSRVGSRLLKPEDVGDDCLRIFAGFEG